MLKNNKKIRIVSYSLTFLAILFATINVTQALATRDEGVEKPLGIVTHNNLSMSVNQISVDGIEGKTDIVSCVDLPDNSDWLPYATIYDGSETIQAEELKLVNYKNPETSESSHRCYHFIFPKAVTSKSVIFTIEKLQTTIPELLTQEMCSNVQNKIRNRYPTFTFSCEIGDHGVGYKITNRPKDMAESQAYPLIREALTNTMNGPWKMDVEVP
jgi:hypothetical protein